MTFHHFHYISPELNLEFAIKRVKRSGFILILWLENMSGLNLGQYYLDLRDLVEFFELPFSPWHELGLDVRKCQICYLL